GAEAEAAVPSSWDSWRSWERWPAGEPGPVGRRRPSMKEKMEGSATRRAARAPLVSIAVAGAAAMALLAPFAFEMTRAGVHEGELWRLLTGHLAHYGLYHFVVDAGTLLALGWMYESRFGPRRWALLLGGAALVISLFF